MKILLSPAKSIQFKDTELSIDFTINSFLKDADVLAKKLGKMTTKKLMSLYDVSPEIAQLNAERFRNWQVPTEKTHLNTTAVFAFTGEVYRGLEVESLNKSELIYLQDHLRILSGLYGILKPMDLFYPYRLEMGTKWEISSKHSSLYNFWRKKLTDYINAEEQELIINLASNEYFKVLDQKKIKARIITPVFKEFKNGSFKSLMTYAKNARGKMTRYCAQNNIQSIDELKLFSEDNYIFNVNLSTDNEFVFTR